MFELYSKDGTVVHFKIKKNTPFRKLITAYCERQGIQKSTVRFTFDGNFVGEEQTPHDVSRWTLIHTTY